MASSALIPRKHNAENSSFGPNTNAEHPSICLVRLQQTRLAFRDDDKAYDLTVASDSDASIQFDHPLGVVYALNRFA